MNDSPPDCNRDAIEGQRRMDAAHRLLEAMREPYLLRARLYDLIAARNRPTT